MPLAATRPDTGSDLIASAREATAAAEALLADATRAVAAPGHRGRPHLRQAASTASSAPPTGSPGSPPMWRRSASSPPTRSA